MTANGPLRVLIVDDEPLARDVLRLLLRAENNIEIVGECVNGIEAVASLKHGGIDVVFLDIQMPGPNGFDVIRAVGVDRMPATIFVTAYDEHAVAAFEVGASDYLLKPVTDERFATALARARRRVAEWDPDDAARRLAELLQRAESEESWLSVRTPGRLMRLRLSEIVWIEAADYYVRIHVPGRSLLVRDSLAAMQERLDPRKFVRIHRSAIVNVDRIREVQPLEHRDHIVILEGGERLRVSRTRRRALEAALGESI